MIGLEPDNACAIEVKDLTKTFGRNPALAGVDLEVRRGDFLVLFGANGAGKTTLIKILATLLRPSGGTVRIGGMDLREHATSIRRQIGLVAHQPLLYDELTAYENLRFWGQMYDVLSLEERISELMNMVDMSLRMNDRVRTFSRGMQQRVSIARALLHRPSIIIMDEPDTGLDRHASSMLGAVLHSLNAEGRTVIMTTHSLERGFEMGSRLAILARGKVAYCESKGSTSLSDFQDAYQRHSGAAS